VIEEFVEKVTGMLNPCSKKEENIMILFVLGVEISSPVAGHHCSMMRSGRKWFVMSLWISLSSAADAWNKCGCKAAIAGKELMLKRGIELSEETEIVGKKMRNGSGVRSD
jgi:hypothetical protein